MSKRLITYFISLISLILIGSNALAQNGRILSTPQPGERIDQMLQRNNIDPSNKRLFIAINWRILTNDDMLMIGYKYELPNKQDIQNSQKIITEGEAARAEAGKGHAAQNSQQSTSSPSTTTASTTSSPKTTSQKSETKKVSWPEGKYGIFPIFGKNYERVEYVDSKLKGAVFYLSSGHGGPDPGAMATYNGQTICEDEYAYDVILRLARQLISHRALVHVIIRDPNDGIRDDAALSNSDNETCMGAPIPHDQIARLRQRSDSINSLYARERTSSTYCRSIFLHVDSRSKEKRIDIFFYHFMKSAKGESLAYTLQAKMAEKYKKHQPNRGFLGDVSTRNLFVLRETNPPGVFIEIANIQNPLDMVRLVKSNNREAIARWLTEGIIEDFNKNK